MPPEDRTPEALPSESRRDFVRQTAAVAGAAGLGMLTLGPQRADAGQPPQARRPSPRLDQERAAPIAADGEQLVREDHFSEDGPWVIAKTEQLKRFVGQVQRCAADATYFRKAVPDAEERIAPARVLELQRETIRQLEGWTAPVGIVHAAFTSFASCHRTVRNCGSCDWCDCRY